MPRPNLAPVALALCLALINSCAHDPALDKKIAEKTASLPAMNAIARAREAEKTIEAAPLAPETRERLESLALSTNTELQALRDQSSRLRLLLVRELMDHNSDDREIDAIKKRILETDQKSSKRWLSALEDARQLLGRKDEEDRRFYKVFMFEPGEDVPGMNGEEGHRPR